MTGSVEGTDVSQDRYPDKRVFQLTADGEAALDDWLDSSEVGDARIRLSEHGPVLIDWQGAVRGPPSADIAHTYLLIATSTIPGTAVERLIGRAGQQVFARAFASHVDPGAIHDYLPVVAARRLQDPSLLPAEHARIADLQARISSQRRR